MKPNLKFSLAVIVLMGILSSCSTNNNVADNGLIQKRKYRKGVNLNFGKQQKQEVSGLAQAKYLKATSEKRIISTNEVKVSKIGKTEEKERDVFFKNDHNSNEFVKTISPVTENAEEIRSIKIEQSPESIDKVSTITKSYQKKGKIALIFAWIFAILPIVVRFFFLAGFIELTVLTALIALVSILIALILGISNAKLSKHARRALLVVFLSMIFWGAAGAILNFVLGIPVI